MSPVSGPVLVGAAIVSSPALWAALVDGTMSPETAFVRYFICVGLCWVAFAIFAMLVGPPPRPPSEPPNVGASHDNETVG